MIHNQSSAKRNEGIFNALLRQFRCVGPIFSISSFIHSFPWIFWICSDPATWPKMALSFYGLLEAALLVLNGIAVLHKDRFLKKVFSNRQIRIFVFLAQKWRPRFSTAWPYRPTPSNRRTPSRTRSSASFSQSRPSWEVRIGFSCLTTRETAIGIFYTSYMLTKLEMLPYDQGLFDFYYDSHTA